MGGAFGRLRSAAAVGAGLRGLAPQGRELGPGPHPEARGHRGRRSPGDALGHRGGGGDVRGEVREVSLDEVMVHLWLSDGFWVIDGF